MASTTSATSPLRPQKKIRSSPLRNNNNVKKTMKRKTSPEYDKGDSNDLRKVLHRNHTAPIMQTTEKKDNTSSKLALRRQSNFQQQEGKRRRQHRKSTFLLNVQIPGRRKTHNNNMHGKHKHQNKFDKVLSGLNTFLKIEETAELVNPNMTTNYLASPKSPASPLLARKQSTVIMHQLKGIEKPKQKKKYKRILKGIKLFNNLSDEDITKIIDNLKVRLFMPGQYICRQGSVGDSMFIVENGTVFVSLNDPQDPEDEEKQKIVAELNKGTVFGEIALMTDNRRTANVRAKDCVKCMYITATVYERIFKEETAEGVLARDAILQREVLEKVKIFRNLKDRQRSKILDVLRPRTYVEGTYICKEGDYGDRFFIVLKGRVQVTVNDVGEITGEREVNNLTANDFFGEIALLEDTGRNANCIAMSEVKVMELFKIHFDLLVPNNVKDQMRREMELLRVGLTGNNFGDLNDEKRKQKANSKVKKFAALDVTKHTSVDALLTDFSSFLDDEKSSDATSLEVQTHNPKKESRKYALRKLKSFIKAISARKSDFCFIGQVLRAIKDEPGIYSRLSNLLSKFSNTNKENKKVAAKLFKDILSKKPQERSGNEVLFITMTLKASKVFHALIEELTPAQLGDLAQHATYEEVDSFTPIYEKGTRGSTAYMVLSGIVRLIETNHSGEKNCTYTLRGGTSFGELACIGMDVRPVTACTTIKTCLLRINRSAYSHAKGWESGSEIMSLSDRSKILMQSGLFNDWANDMLFQITFEWREETYESGSIIAQEGLPSKGLFVIVGGSISIWKKKNQKQQNLAKQIKRRQRPHSAKISHATRSSIANKIKRRGKYSVRAINNNNNNNSNNNGLTTSPAIDKNNDKIEDNDSDLHINNTNNYKYNNHKNVRESITNRFAKTTPTQVNYTKLSLNGPGSVIGFSLIDPAQSVERVTYVAESKVHVLMLPKDIFKQEISGLTGTNMKTRHRGTLHALKKQFVEKNKFYPGQVSNNFYPHKSKKYILSNTYVTHSYATLHI